MSATVTADGQQAKDVQKSPSVPSQGGNYKGFVAGVFSGIAKLSVGSVNPSLWNEEDILTCIKSHPFDTIKVRLQTSQHSQFKGPLDCLLQTLRKEGVNGIYKVSALMGLELKS